MKIGRIITVVAIVVVGHAAGLLLLMRSSQMPAASASQPEEAVQQSSESAKPSPSEAVVSGQRVPSGTSGKPVSESVRESSTPVYAPFVNDPGDLPSSIESRVSRDCRSGILVDLKSRRILWQKDAHKVYAIASMSKIMTAYELLCELKAPGCKVTLNTPVKVPRKMYRKFSDCHIYMDPRESFTVDELLKCMMIHSANDCAYLLAEFMAGSEAAFVSRMNARAKSLGLNHMMFYNSNGLPDRRKHQANRGTAMEMAMLSERVLDIPEIMKWAGTKMDAIREDTPKRRFQLNNKNRLLGDRRCPGIDGLKTGYIDESKFCISVTCKRQDRRMVCVVMGSETAHRRDRLVRELINWGYSVR